MGFTIAGDSVSLQVTEAGQSIAIPLHATQCRVYNAGPNNCRIVYGRGAQVVTNAGMLMPVGLMETHTKHGVDTLSARCNAGETATLEITCGTSD